MPPDGAYQDSGGITTIYLSILILLGFSNAFSALTLLVWRQEGSLASKKTWGRVVGGTVSPVGVAPTRTVGKLPLPQLSFPAP